MSSDRHPDGAGRGSQTLADTLAAATRGEVAPTPELFAQLYGELHRLAKRQVHAHAGGSTLGATTLLHEAYLDIAHRAAVFPDRARFFGYAARAMRGLIIDYVRERKALKRGGEFHLTALSTQIADELPEAEHLSGLSEALEELAAIDPALAELVDLKFFCGFSFGDIAGMRNVSERTVQRDWNKARLLLHRFVKDA